VLMCIGEVSVVIVRRQDGSVWSRWPPTGLFLHRQRAYSGDRGQLVDDGGSAALYVQVQAKHD
jgi:hypothetical protein